MDRIRVWWHAPKLHEEEDQGRERKVSWLELFYDLVFVVIIARLSHYLGHHLDSSGVVGFVFLFVPVFWVWISGSIYNDRFETVDVSYRVMVFLQILAVSSMAVFIEGGLDKTADAFAYSYVACRALIILMWWRAGWHSERGRPLAYRYAMGFSVGAGLWLFSTLVDNPLSFWLKGLGLLLDLILPLTTTQIQRKLPRLSTSKLTERFGLFVIIVLGESLLGVINGLADAKSINTITALRFGLGMALVFGLWWIYFDYVARRHPQPQLLRRILWNYSHFPLVMGITALSAVLVHLVGLEGEALEAFPRWVALGGYAVAMVCIGLQLQLLEAEKYRVIDEQRVGWWMWGTAAAALLLGLLPLNASLTLAVLMVFNLFFMLHGAIAWFSSPASKVSHAEEI